VNSRVATSTSARFVDAEYCWRRDTPATLGIVERILSAWDRVDIPEV
jgi:hypothetical protein